MKYSSACSQALILPILTQVAVLIGPKPGSLAQTLLLMR